jgi:beta-carotene ketolase (CrtW type)
LAARKNAQAITGITLAATLFAAWAALHLYAMFGFTLTWSSAPLAVLMGIALCWLSVGLFIVSHDAMHGSLAPGMPRVNAFVGGALLFLYAGFGWRRMRDAHHAHHRHAGTARDPDFAAATPRSLLMWYATFLRRYFGWPSILYVGTIVTVYWAVLDVPVVNIVALFGIPALASSFQLFYFGTYRPHHHDDAGFADHHNARSETFGTLASLLSCFHFGYHLEHHRRPDLPWWALPGAHRQGIAK